MCALFDKNPNDHLELAYNEQCKQMLAKNPELEQVIFSVKLSKINKKEKNQDRVLLITNKAVYNLKPKDFRKYQRRIEIAKIWAITISTISDEIVLHVPEEYDYRYKTDQKDMIAKIIKQLFKQIEGKEMTVNRVEQDSLSYVTMTKSMKKSGSKRDIPGLYML